MKHIIAIAIVSLIALIPLGAAETGWMTDYPGALKKAGAEKKPLLLDFTGSDWCPPCKSLHKNVLATKEFKEFAQKKLVLVELDFPRRKAQSDELKAANRKLAQQFKIEGYPTVILLESSGKEIWREVGYRGDKPGDYIKKLEEALAKKK